MNPVPSKASTLGLLVCLCISVGLCVPGARATYSIIACDEKTRACGVAVQTNNLAVGSSVPYAQAGIGALVSQFETNPSYGPRGLALLAQGKSPAESLKQLLSEDGNFEGQGPEARQVAIVSLDGRTAVHTGEEAQAAAWAGSRSGHGYSIQGNGLAGAQVVDAMEQAFLKTSGALADRLLAALTEGDAAGGQKTGRESAALLVKTTDGYPIDVDLRVDHSADPVADLRMLFNMESARQQVGQARRAARDGHLDQAKALLIRAVARASMWPRVWLQAARVAADIEEPELALQYLNVAFSQNPAWAEAEIGDGRYSALGGEAIFHQWVTAEQEQEAIAGYQKFSKVKSASQEERFGAAKVLLEVGRSTEATAMLTALLSETGGAVQAHALLADAYASHGDYPQAVEQCQAALKSEPGNARLRVKMIRLQGEMETRSIGR